MPLSDDQLLARLESFADRLNQGGESADAQAADGEDDALAAGQDLLRLLDRVRQTKARDALPAELLDATAQPPRVGRFEIIRELGRGGFGIVFLAYDPKLNRSVALKIPRGELLLDDDKQRRFLGEAETAAALDHPHIVPIYEAGTIGATAYIVSAYCPGPDLAAWLDAAAEPPPVRHAAELVCKLAEAVHAAHQKGVVHRDLKPSNVLLVPRTNHSDAHQPLESYEPRLTDFGLAKLVENDFRQTRTSLVIGTPLYMAPELLERVRDKVGPAVDVYSLGVILFELVSGRPPIEGATYLEVADQIREAPPPRLRSRRPDCPRDLETVCERCLEKAPELRYESAADLARDLGAIVNGEPIQEFARRPLARLLYWSRRPHRIRDAAVFSIGFQAFVAIWLVVMIAMLPIYEIQPEVIRRTHAEAAIVIVTIHGLMAAVSWLALRGKRWAVNVGFALSSLHLLTPLSRLAGNGLFADIYRGEDFYAFNIFALIFLGFITQFVLYAFALIANRASK